MLFASHLKEVVVLLLLAQVEAGQAVVGVAADVAVYDVQQHHDAQPVRLVDECLLSPEIICPMSTTCMQGLHCCCRQGMVDNDITGDSILPVAASDGKRVKREPCKC